MNYCYTNLNNYNLIGLLGGWQKFDSNRNKLSKFLLKTSVTCDQCLVTEVFSKENL